MFRQFSHLLLKNRWHAVLVALLLTVLPVFTWDVAVIVLALVTLRRGAIEGALLIICLSIPFLVQAYLQPTLGHFQLFYTYLLMGVGTWLLAIVLRDFPRWSVLIGFNIAITVLVFFVMHLTEKTQSALLLNAFLPVIHAAPDQAELAPFLHLLQTHPMFFVFGFAWWKMMVANLLTIVLARAWQSALFHPGGLRAELSTLQLSPLWCLPGIATGLWAWQTHLPFAIALCAVFAAGYLFTGFCVLYRLSLRFQREMWGWLLLAWIVFFVVFVLLFPVMGPLVVCFGLLDSLRRTNHHKKVTI